MEWFLIEYYKAAIKKHNDENKDRKELVIKHEISTYSAPWKQIMWGLLILTVVSLALFVLLIVKIAAKLSIESWEIKIYLWSLPVALVAMMIYIILQARLSRRFAKENLEIHKLRLKILQGVIEDVYKKDDIDKKVELLAEIYKSRLQELEKEDSKRYKLAWVVLSLAGSIAAISIANLDKIGIGFNEWAQVILVILVIALILVAPLYLSTQINPTRDRYSLMVDRLNHLKIMLVNEDKVGPSFMAVSNSSKESDKQEDKNDKQRANKKKNSKSRK